MTPASVTISGVSASEPTGERELGPLTIQGLTVIGDTVTLSLQAGDNVVSIPPGAVGVVVVPPSKGSATLKYRTSLNSGDTGLPISPTQPFLHAFPSPAPSAVIVNASASVPGLASFWAW